MKSVFRIFGLVVLAAVTGFFIMACPDSDETASPPAGTPVDSAVIDGLWWNEGLMKGGGDDPGVWVFHYPDFWRLNNWGSARKGTFTVSGETSGGVSNGTFIVTVTRKKDNTTAWTWNDTSAEEGEKTWSLSADGEKLAIGAFDYIKTSWEAPENNASNGGIWQTKIGDSALTALIESQIIPDLEDYGWVEEEGVEFFRLPPLLDQPTDNLGAFQINNKSAARNLYEPFTTSVVAAAQVSPPSNEKMLSIRTNSVDSHTNQLPAALFWQAKYIALKLGDDFDDSEWPKSNLITGLYAPSLISYSDTLWSNSVARMEENGAAAFNIFSGGQPNEARGCKYDAANKLLVIELEKAVPLYETFQKPITGNMKLIITWPGGSSGDGYFDQVFDLQAVYLVNIVGQ